MRISAKIFVYLALAISFVGCGEHNSKIDSSGNNYEVYVVTSENRWRGPLGDTLRYFLTGAVEMINQPEPRLSLYYIKPEAYNTLISRHRNLILVEVNDKFKEAAISAKYNVNSEPQIIVSLVAPSEDSLVSYVARNGENLARVFEIAEKDRYVKYALNYGEDKLEELVRQKFGFEMAIPRSYKLRNQLEDFLWLSDEKRYVSQGIIIYSYPYIGKSDFSLESLVKRRNEFVRNIPGPADGSYMTTSSVVVPDISYITINNRPWAELKGFWDVEGDYMGGPMRSYSTLDIKNQRVICIDFYLYSPKKDKRNYIRELENLIYTVKVE